MTRLQRLSPALLTALLAACSEAQPYVQPVAPAAASAVVVDAGLGDRTAKLDLRSVAAYALQQATTVHRWVPADLVRYDVELRVRNASVATQYDAIGMGLTAQVPVGANAAGTATFTKLQQGKLYRAYVKAMGRKDGSAGSDTIVQMNASAQNDHVDFDFTAANDVASEVSRTVTVSFDNVAFSGTGALSFGTPSPGAYVGPSEGPAVAVSNPPVPGPAAATFNVIGNPKFLGVNSAGELWVGNAGSSIQRYSATGSALGTTLSAFFGHMGVSGGNLWAYGTTGIVSSGRFDALTGTAQTANALVLIGSTVTYGYGAGGKMLVWTQSGLSTNATILGTAGTSEVSHSSPLAASMVGLDAQSQAWVASNNVLYRHSSNLTQLSSVALGNMGEGMAFDSAGNVWVPLAGQNAVAKVSSVGVLLGTYPVGTNAVDAAVDGQGKVWVLNRDAKTVSQLNSAGSLLGTYSVGNGPQRVVAQGNHVWVSNQTDGTVTHFTLPSN